MDGGLFANKLQEDRDDDGGGGGGGGGRHPAAKNGHQLKRRFSKIVMETNETLSAVGDGATMTSLELPRMKASDRRSRCFQRAFSCDVAGSPDVRVEASSRRTCRSQELEMTCVEKDKLFGDGSSDDKIIRKGSSAEESDGGGTLTAATKGAGIVCSDEDLRLILTEVAQSRRLSADAKREKMKSNRSLSLDSSFFKLHMKRLQADSPGWLARILNQKEPSKSAGGSGTVSETPSPSSSSMSSTATTTSPTLMNAASGCSDDLLRKRSTVSKKPDATPETIVEGDDGSSVSSRRESNVSCGSDDEHSLLLNTSNLNNNNNNNNDDDEDNSEVNVAAEAVAAAMTGSQASSAQPTAPPRKAASKVVWAEGSVVDAEILGTAIEIYLTSVNTKKPSGTDSCKCLVARQPDVGGAAGSGSSAGRDTGQSTGGVPVVSTLKGLFVK